MSSAAFSPSNAYQAPPAPAPAKLDRESWNAVMGSIAERLAALEAKRTELQDLINDLSFNGQARLDEAIVPLITQTQAQIDELQRRVAETIAANGAIIETFQEDIAEALASLNAQIAAVERRVDTILAGGIPAADVAESATRVFVTPAQKAEIGALRQDLTSGLAGRLSTAPKAVGEGSLADNAVSRRVLADDFFGTEAEAVSAASGVPVDAKGVASAIAALAGASRVDTFFESGTFTKEADDFAYVVELLAGGQGGSSGASRNNTNTTGLTVPGGDGGAPGAYMLGFALASDINSSVFVVIGAGGLGSAGGGGSTEGARVGGSGGDTTFGTIFAASGGGASTDAVLFIGRGSGGVGGTVNSSGVPVNTTMGTRNPHSPGRYRPYGGSGGGGANSFNGGAVGPGAAASPGAGEGGGGAYHNNNAGQVRGADGGSATERGCGGGGGGGAVNRGTGGAVGGTGGNGAPGEARVWRIKRPKA